MRRLTALWNSQALPAFIFLIGAMLRLRYVGSSFCIDDNMVLRDSLHFIPQSVERFRPVFSMLFHVWRSIGPDTDLWIQLLLFAFSFAAVPLAWRVGLRLGGRNTAAALSLLLAVSPIHLDITSELRMYGLLSVLGLLQLLCYLRYRDEKKNGLLWANTLIGAIAMYTQPMYVLFLAGLFLLSLTDRQSIPFGRYFASLAAIAVCFIPNSIFMLKYASHVQGSSHAFTTHAVSAPFKLIAAYTTSFTYFHVFDLGLGAKFGLREVIANWPLFLVAAAAFLLILFGMIRQLRKPEERLVRNMLFMLVILPFAVTYAGVLIMNRDFTHAQYQITGLPVILLAIYKGFQGLRTRNVLQVAAVALYSLVIAIALYHFLIDTQNYGRRSDWKKAARYVEQHASPREPLLLFESKEGRRMEYYYMNRYAFDTMDSWRKIAHPIDFESTEAYTAYLQERLKSYDTVYYLWESVGKNLLDPRNSVVKGLRALSVDEKKEIINPRLVIYRWTLRR